MTAEQLEPDVNMLEVQLFDIWVIGRRQGVNPDVEELAEQLPEERRAAFKQMVRATAALQILAGVSPVRKQPDPSTFVEGDKAVIYPPDEFGRHDTGGSD